MIFSEVTIHHKAILTVGVPINETPVRDNILDTISLFSKANPRLELPNPRAIFPGLIDIVMLPWEEARVVKKCATTMPVHGLGVISFKELLTDDHSIDDAWKTTQDRDRIEEINREYTPT